MGRVARPALSVVGGLLLCSAGACPGLLAQGLSFLPGPRTSVVARARTVEAGDLEGDGRVDIVAAIEERGLSVLRQQHDGSFVQQVLHQGGAARAVVIDLDGNGRDDIAATVPGTPNGYAVLILASQANGTLLETGRYPVGDAATQANWLEVGDLDRDGKPDIVTGNWFHDTVSVLRALPGGGYAPQVTFPVTGGPTAVIVADLDGDGLLDVAGTDYLDDRVSVLLGDGNGGLGPETSYPVTGDGPYHLASGDLDQDGHQDLVTANYYSNDVSVFPGAPAGLLPETRYPAGTGPNGVAVGDMDLDGWPDIVTANFNSDDLSVLDGQPGGGFAPDQRHVTGDGPGSVILVDVDQDVDLDFIVAENYGQAVLVLANNRAGPTRRWTDTFDRADSPVVGNGWQEIDGPGTGVRIQGGRLFFSGEGGVFVVHRPADPEIGSLGASFSWLYRKGTDIVEADSVSARHDGVTSANSGLCVNLIVGADEVTMEDAGQYIGIASYPFQIDTDYQVAWDIHPDGSTDLTIWQPGAARPSIPVLSTPPRTIVSSGTRWAIGNRLDAHFDDFTVEKQGCASSVEVCNGVDDDLDNVVDEGCDADGDGYCAGSFASEALLPACPLGSGDCLDTDSAVHPGAEDVCGDGLDGDCDPATGGPTFLIALFPDSAVKGGPGFTLEVSGDCLVDGSVVSWNGLPRPTTFVNPSLLEAEIDAADLDIAGDFSLAVVTVTAPGGAVLTSPDAFSIAGSTVASSDAIVVTSGEREEVFILPGAAPGAVAGIASAVWNEGDPDPLYAAAASYSEAPAGGAYFELGAGYVDLQVLGADDADSAESLFYYATGLPPEVEDSLTLLYFDGAAWAEVLTSGGQPPLKDTTDDQDGTISGGSFAVLFDATSTPPITALTGTMFTFTDPRPAILEIGGPATPLAAGATAELSLSYRALGDAADHLVTVDWDDGSGETFVPAVPGQLNVSHEFASADVHTVTFTVEDGAGRVATGRYEFVVVYDPSAGFVTGGGWIQSPAGALAANPLLTGKATFGFVARYKKGASVPTGNTEFKFHLADFNFRSTAYEWLVVSGARAQYKGTGTINGSGSHAFKLTAIDGDSSGGGGTDRFRIKIWDTANDSVIYDNVRGAPDDPAAADPQAVGGGSIVIHKG